MQSAPRPVPAEQTEAPQYGPTAREVRAQLVQRLQVGLFGLSLMLLLVGLANIIMDQARRNDAAMAQSAQATATTSGNTTDPLADIGVVPSPDAPQHRSAAGHAASSAGH